MTTTAVTRTNALLALCSLSREPSKPATDRRLSSLTFIGLPARHVIIRPYSMAYVTILEPMSTGDVIDRAVRLYRRNFTPLISIVAVPSLLGYFVTMMFWFGLSELTNPTPTSAGVGGMLLIFGLLGYVVWGFIWLATVSGLSRVIGDHLMLGEPITFRRCFAAVRRRLGDITLMGLLSIALLMALYIVFGIITFVALMVVGVLTALTASAGLPTWLSVTVITIVIVAAVLGGVAAILIVMARVVFLPQVVMIEGQSAGSAIGRALRLGGRNWYRVGAIVLFTYFVSLSIVAALRLPLMTGLYMAGTSIEDMLTSPAWNVVYQGFDQISSLLALPIWVVSFTLLYFDSRVRKEAYDVELLAREVNPGFYWQPSPQPAGYQPPPVPFQPIFVQTGPLGLAGYRPPPRPAPSPPVEQTPAEPSSPADELRKKFEEAATSLHAAHGESGGAASPGALDDAGTSDESPGPTPSGDLSAVGTEGARSVDVAPAECKQCGAELRPGARYCMKCGTMV
ncbi:MAG TPA: zinc ribbon domain-containing protein [Blastocatellia bacterium]|nr:zinc ribbon domain-containing protein [Blastocatellia bacterium]